MVKEKHVEQISEFTFMERLRIFFETSASKKFLAISIFIILILIAGIYIFSLYYKKTPACGDGTLYSQCSVNVPYYCDKGQLIEKASVCNCSENMLVVGDECVSDYKVGLKELQLEYSAGRKSRFIFLQVYEGVYNYVAGLSRSVNGNVVSLADLKLRRIDDPVQREFLLPLVISIQNLDKGKKDQAEIAISLVQNIYFKASNKTVIFADMELDYQRYPYEALYEEEGVCSEKSDLLAFLLKELGFEVVIFHFAEENHEAVGIKCNEGDFQNSGYCYIETTTDQDVTASSDPIIVLISEGESVEDI